MQFTNMKYVYTILEAFPNTEDLDWDSQLNTPTVCQSEAGARTEMSRMAQEHIDDNDIEEGTTFELTKNKDGSLSLVYLDEDGELVRGYVIAAHRVEVLN